MGACLYGFQLLKNRIAALFIAGTTRVFLICFGVHYWLVPLESSVVFFIFTAVVSVVFYFYYYFFYISQHSTAGIWVTVSVMLLWHLYF